MTAQQTPPGWYTNPQTGVQQFWDGAAWGQVAQVVQAPPRPPLNTNAAVGFWLGLGSFLIFLLWPLALVVAITSLVLSIIGYRQARRMRQRGTGFAVWGIVFAVPALIFGVGALITTFAS